jgi:CBS domain-containing protein
MKVKDCALIEPLACKLDTPIVEAAKTLRDNKQRRIIVVDLKHAPVGIISTTDINNKVVAENRSLSQLVAKDIMTSPIYLVCTVEDDLGDIFAKMHEHQSFFVPITKSGKLFGILTHGEIMHVIKEAMANRTRK